MLSLTIPGFTAGEFCVSEVPADEDFFADVSKTLIVLP
jgi:hypothetical protein